MPQQLATFRELIITMARGIPVPAEDSRDWKAQRKYDQTDVPRNRFANRNDAVPVPTRASHEPNDVPISSASAHQGIYGMDGRGLLL